MELNKKLPLEEILGTVRDKYLSEGRQALYDDGDWRLYHGEDGRLFPSTVCCITALPDFDEEADDEILPDFASENEAVYPVLAEIIQDVVISAVDRKRDISPEALTAALNYYLEKDTFMEV